MDDLTDAEKAKEARKAYLRQYKVKNKERLAEYQREYFKGYRANNPDKIKGYNEKYFSKLYDKMQEQQQEEG